MTIDKVMDRVRKLLALAAEQSNDSEHERNLAMQHAQELMLKHGLEMSMIEGTTDEERKVTEERFEVLEEDWRRSLLDSIARGSFARTYYYTGSNRTVIVGRPEQVAFVKELYHFLVPQLEASAIKTMKAYDKRAQYAYLYGLRALTVEVAAGQSPIWDIRDATQDDIAAAGLRRFYAADDRKQGAEDIAALAGIALNYAKEVRPFVKREEIAPGFAQHTGVFMRSFFMSAAATVSQRLQATQTRFANEGGDNAMALVKNETKAVDDFMDELDLKKQKSQNKYDREGWNAGATAARDFSINLSKPVAGGRKELPA
jgi:hypothetical protein